MNQQWSFDPIFGSYWLVFLLAALLILPIGFLAALIGRMAK